MFEFESLPEKKSDGSKCKGLYYRARTNMYKNTSKGAYIETRCLIPLIRMSCKGCEQCEWMFEYLDEDMGVGMDSPIPEHIIDGELYVMKVIDTSIDWESGLCDDVMVGFKKVEEGE